jgi:hypothetical protein
MSGAPEHLVKSYDQELKRLRNMMTQMGGIVETQVALAADAIMHRDAAAATRAVEEDPKVDALEREIETFVIRLLALRQPVAGDLRHIVAALKITGDLERIGDYAANVAKRSIVLAQFALPYSLAGLAHIRQSPSRWASGRSGRAHECDMRVNEEHSWRPRIRNCRCRVRPQSHTTYLFGQSLTAT